MKNKSLRFKITFFTGLIMTLTCVFLTANSIFSARYFYNDENYKNVAENIIDNNEEDLVFPDPPQYDIISQSFSMFGIYVMIGTIAVSILLIYYFIGKALKPLWELNEKIKSVDESTLDERILILKSSAEIYELTNSYNKMLDRLERSFNTQKQFTSSAAHELKTPLTVINTSIEVLEMDENPSDDDYKDFISDMKESIGRLIKTVNGLISLAEDNISEMNYEHIDLQELSNIAAEELKEMSEKNNIKIILPENSINIYSDKIMVYRMIYNLIENAIKYNKEGGLVNISLNNSDKECRLTVSDTGIGMSDETINHIFDPFYREDKSRSQNIPGLGLGMSILKSIADRCNAEIKIKSELGKGSDISVIFK